MLAAALESPFSVAELLVFLGEVRKVQENLLQIQSGKREALIAGEWPTVHDQEQQEQAAQQELQVLWNRRKQMLHAWQQAGISATTLQQGVDLFGWEREARMSSLLREVRLNTERLRRESWGLWVMAQRSARCYAHLLELLAQGGEKSPVYHQHQEAESIGGGAFLDAAM